MRSIRSCQRRSPVRRHAQSRLPARAARLFAASALFLFAAHHRADAAVDTSQLPEPAPAPVDFARDIQPLLDRSCLRCHGPERPKSNFRLDNREAALKGGSSGVDIIVSNSVASPLIHYVAHLPGIEEDLRMPPEGTTPPLTREEIALFRAWIDQGLPWTTNASPPSFAFDLAPTVGWIGLSGNESVFREHHWMPDGWNGGAEQFQLRTRLDDRTELTSEGHFLVNDYQLLLQVDRRDLGFVRSGFEQFRKYYSDTGGYEESFSPPAFSLDRDLHLDLGRAWLDLGLTLPRWPKITLGYEYQYKDGEKSLTSWSPVTQNGTTRYLFPASKSVDEDTHILKFRLDHELHGVRVEDDFRAEWSGLSTARTNTVLNPPGSDTLYLDRVKESQDSFQAANAVRLERQFTSWLLGSGGYLYSHFDAEANFSLDETYLSGSPGFARRWRSPGIVLDRDANVGNLNAQFGPWDGLTGTAGVQSEWSRQNGLGDVSTELAQQPGDIIVLQQTNRALSALDRTTVTEHVGLRYAKIPRTVLFAEGRLQQEELDQFEDQPGGDYPLRRDTDASTDLLNFRGGFSTSPWSRFSFSASYGWFRRHTSYDHVVDVVPTAFGDFPSLGYSAFIRDRRSVTDEVESRLTYHWSSSFRTTFSYRFLATDSWTATDPVDGFDPITFEPIPGGITPGTRILAGNYDAHIYSLNAWLRPLSRLNLNGTFSLQDARTLSAANDADSIQPYGGQTYSLLLSGSYAWNPKTDLLFGYGFSLADYEQDPAPDSLQLGVLYRDHSLFAGIRRRISEHLTTTLRYRFFKYDEPTSGGFNDYTAHGVFATLGLRLP